MDAATPPTVVQRRIAVAAAICVMAFALVGVRLVDVMLLNGRVSGATSTAAADALATRADLLDRNGELLARDLPVHDLYAQPAYLANKAQAAKELSQATGASEDRLNRIFECKHPLCAGRAPDFARHAEPGDAARSSRPRIRSVL